MVRSVCQITETNSLCRVYFYVLCKHHARIKYSIVSFLVFMYKPKCLSLQRFLCLIFRINFSLKSKTNRKRFHMIPIMQIQQKYHILLIIDPTEKLMTIIQVNDLKIGKLCVLLLKQKSKLTLN